MRQIVLCHPVRTAIGSYGGSLKGVVATELGAVAIRETLRRASLDVSKLARRDDGQRRSSRQPHEPGSAGRGEQ